MDFCPSTYYDSNPYKRILGNFIECFFKILHNHYYCNMNKAFLYSAILLLSSHIPLFFPSLLAKSPFAWELSTLKIKKYISISPKQLINIDTVTFDKLLDRQTLLQDCRNVNNKHWYQWKKLGIKRFLPKSLELYILKIISCLIRA